MDAFNPEKVSGTFDGPTRWNSRHHRATGVRETSALRRPQSDDRCLAQGGDVRWTDGSIARFQPWGTAMSDTPDATGEIASKVTTSDATLTEVVTGASEAAGAAEEVASIEKVKLHKDNPTQIPIGRKE